MVRIASAGPVGEREVEGLAGHVFADVRSQSALPGQFYMGYGPIWESVFPTRARPRPDAHRCNVFESGGEIGYHLVLDNYTSQPVKATFDLHVDEIDFKDAAAESRRTLTDPFLVRVPCRADQCTVHRVCFRIERFGTYELAWSARLADRSIRGFVRFAVVPPYDSGIASRSPFGLHQPHFRMAQLANLSWVRHSLENWVEQQGSLEKFDWELADARVEYADAHNIRLMGIVLCCDRPEYPHRPLKDYGNFRRFMRTLAARYRGRPRFWEIGNEMDHAWYFAGTQTQYVEMLRAGYQGAKEGDPDCVVSMAGIGKWDVPMLYQELHRAGLADCTDVLNMHPGYDGPPEKHIPRFAWFRQWRDRYLPGRQIWLGEDLWHDTADKSSLSDQEKAGWVVRTMVIDRAYDVDASCWALARDRPSWHWGVYREDLTPKVGFVALAALSTLACDRECRPVCEGADGTYHYCFERLGEGRRLHVVWNLLGPREYAVDLASDTTVLDLCGNVEDALTAGRRSLEVTTVPRYLLENTQ